MPVVRIDTADDPRLEAFRSLKQTNLTRWQHRYVAEGEKLVERLLASGLPVESLLLGESHLQRFAGRTPEETPVYVVADELVEQIVGFNFHRGVLACGRRPPAPELEQIVANRSAGLRLVICPDVQDPQNLGAILRIGSAFGVNGVLLGSSSTDPFSRRVLRVSMGASFQLPIRQTADLAAELVRLSEEHGCELWATVLDPAATDLASVAAPRRLGLVFGSEGHGLSAEWIQRCQRRVTLPMAAGVDSLNVAVAAGIFLYETRRTERD
jgi:tRNA G18 (ribose-2'-O)-methylase SpoU